MFVGVVVAVSVALAAEPIRVAGRGYPDFHAAAEALPSPTSRLAESLVSTGDTARLTRFFARAEAGARMTIGCIGGSITVGAITKGWKPENRYVNRLGVELKGMFPKSDFTMVNAGRGATGSEMGAFRCHQEILSKKPDLVIVEFSVNDANTDRPEGYEGLLRQILSAPGEVAVVALGMMTSTGASSERAHAAVCRHYGVPFVSYRQALWPSIAAGTLAWTEISPDTIHPNDIGHIYAAKLLAAYFEQVRTAWQAAGRPLAAVPTLAVALYGHEFDRGRFVPMQRTNVRENKGFRPIDDRAWGAGLVADNPGDRLVVEVDGATVGLVYRKGFTPRTFGHVRVTLDGKDVSKALECHWGKLAAYSPTLYLCRRQPGRHVLTIDVLNEKNAESKGYGCLLLGLVVAE